MILKHQHFDIEGEVILERVIYRPPLRKDTSMYNSACLMYNVTGQPKLYSVNQTETMGEDNCVLMKCGQYFTSVPATHVDSPSEMVAVHFYPAVLKIVFADNLPNFFSQKMKKTSASKAISRIEVDKVLKNYIESLLFFFENPSLVTDELVLLKVKEVILLLLNTNSKEAEKIKTVLSDLFNPSQASLKEVIDSHCLDNLTVAQLATLSNMSLSTFKRRFGELFGETPATYIRKKKLERAAQLLQKSEASVASICYDTGFSDTSNFTKTFSTHFHCTPSEFRQKHRLNQTHRFLN